MYPAVATAVRVYGKIIFSVHVSGVFNLMYDSIHATLLINHAMYQLIRLVCIITAIATTVVTA